MGKPRAAPTDLRHAVSRARWSALFADGVKGDAALASLRALANLDPDRDHDRDHDHDPGPDRDLEVVGSQRASRPSPRRLQMVTAA